MAGAATNVFNIPTAPSFATVAEERQHRKRGLAALPAVFEVRIRRGVAGHITARDPERRDHFWVNPFGMHFRQIRASDLILVNHRGEVVEGKYPVNVAAFCDSLAGACGATRGGCGGACALDVWEGVVIARTAPRPNHAGCLGVLRWPRAISGFHGSCLRNQRRRTNRKGAWLE